VPFEVSCRCGGKATGSRRAQHQVVSCPSCGRDLFVFPNSALAAARQPPAARTARLGRWLLLTLAASVPLMFLVALAARPYLSPSTAETSPPRNTTEPGLDAQVTLGQHALGQGHYRLALERLTSALDLARTTPGALPPEQERHLVQLHRQSELLAGLLHESLEEIVQHGQRIRDDREWAAQFVDYHGKAVLFDDVVRLVNGKPVLCFYEVRAGTETARVALEDLAVLEVVPLDTPRRLIFGARLASCRRETRGRWVIRFLPDSGVLLTDPSAAAGCCPTVDEALRDVLHRQQQWLNQRMKDEG
jgi:hypothetical protein